MRSEEAGRLCGQEERRQAVKSRAKRVAVIAAKVLRRMPRNLKFYVIACYNHEKDQVVRLCTFAELKVLAKACLAGKEGKR